MTTVPSSYSRKRRGVRCPRPEAAAIRYGGATSTRGLRTVMRAGLARVPPKRFLHSLGGGMPMV
jgi:hypothetical protein